MRFSSRLKELREERQLTQLELSNVLNVHKTAISNWENARRFPDEDMLHKIANYFNVTMDSLLKGESENGRKPNLLQNTDSNKSTAAKLIDALIQANIIDVNGEADEEVWALIKSAIKKQAQEVYNKKDANK